MFYKIVLIIRW